MSSVRGKVIVITGASAGIGASLARLVAKQGASVALLARRREALEQVAKECAGEPLVVVADVTKRADVQRARDEVLARFGTIDVWVNNAGRGISRQPSELTDDDIDDMVLANVKSAWYGVQAVLPHFRARGAGQIVNVSSMLGRVPFASIRSAYTAAKHALNGLTASLRMELRTSHPGIVVTTVSPGVVATDFGNNAKHGGMDSRALPNAQSADDVAAVIVDAIVNARVDVYTLPHARDTIAAYYAADDMGAFEAKLGGPPGR